MLTNQLARYLRVRYLQHQWNPSVSLSNFLVTVYAYGIVLF